MESFTVQHNIITVALSEHVIELGGLNSLKWLTIDLNKAENKT